MKMTIWELLTLAPLMVCSLILLALILERAVYLRSAPLMPLEERQTLLGRLMAGEWPGVWQHLSRRSLFYREALERLYEWRERDKILRDDAAATIMLGVQEGLQARLAGVMAIAALAPMFGLLGTIVGLMRAFREIGLHQGPVEPSLVADGLWQALTTTAIGLVIAAVAIIAHAMLSAAVRSRLTEANLVLNKFSLSVADQPEVAES